MCCGFNIAVFTNPTSLQESTWYSPPPQRKKINKSQSKTLPDSPGLLSSRSLRMHNRLHLQKKRAFFFLVKRQIFRKWLRANAKAMRQNWECSPLHNVDPPPPPSPQLSGATLLIAGLMFWSLLTFSWYVEVYLTQTRLLSSFYSLSTLSMQSSPRLKKINVNTPWFQLLSK